MLLTLALSALWLTSPTPAPTPTPTPTPTVVPTTPAPVRPALSATIGKVRCPARQVPVTVVNDTGKGVSYTLRTNGTFVREEYVPADSVIKGSAQLKEDVPADISVLSADRTIASAERTANCRKRAGAPDSDQGHHQGSGPAVPKLPHTGGGAEALAKTATGLAVVATGGLLIFWGRLWPGTGRGDWSTPVRRSVD